MPYIQRDKQGKIIGLYANRQEGYAEELLANDHPEVVAFRDPPPMEADYARAIQSHLDSVARERGYDSVFTAATYAGSRNPQWAAEAAALIAWRDAVWAHAYAELATVQAGQRAQPTIAEIVAELPEMTWPG
jgi:hypothetical protein